MSEERINFPYVDDMKNYSVNLKSIRTIYEKMADDISKDIYVSRLLLSLTGNQTYMKKALSYTKGGGKLIDIVDSNQNRTYIYGAGIRGKRIAETFPDCKWGGFIDQNSKDSSYRDIRIFSLKEFLTRYRSGDIVIVSNMLDTEKIVSDLCSKMDKKNIYILNDLDKESMQDIYFSIDEIRRGIHEDSIFVDVGCFDGKDSLKYLEWIGNKNATVFAFEPDEDNYKVCENNLRKYTNIRLWNVGLDDKEEHVGISGSGEMAHFEKEGDKYVKTRILDNIVVDEQIGYIKMDVEGFEEHVLRGAERIIKIQHPALAISVYHKISDVWKLPNLILELYGGYRFYMRHYSATNSDTVLYAIASD